VQHCDDEQQRRCAQENQGRDGCRVGHDFDVAVAVPDMINFFSLLKCNGIARNMANNRSASEQ
jgi:hypothetical protein